MLSNMQNENSNDGKEFGSLLTLLDGDEEALKTILKAFIEDVPENVSGIRIDCENKNWLAAKRKVHHIKPFYGYAGDQKIIALLDKWLLEFEDAPTTFDFRNDLQKLEFTTHALILKLKSKFDL
jgi:hypothetical protein